MMKFTASLEQKSFDGACLYNIALKFIFFASFREIKSFGSVKLGKFYRVGRVTLNRGTFFFGLRTIYRNVLFRTIR